MRSYTDLPVALVDQVTHFFRHYKDLEQGKWTEITGWVDAQAAVNLVTDAIARAGGAPDAVGRAPRKD